MGTSGNDFIEATSLAETISGAAGDDFIQTKAEGGDVIDGGAGRDTVLYDLGGYDNGTLRADMTTGRVTFGGQVDTLTRVEALVITGARDAEVLGRAGDDLIVGGAGDDLLRGGDGDDTLSSGAGRDTLHGGAGVDVVTLPITLATPFDVYGLDDGGVRVTFGAADLTLYDVERIKVASSTKTIAEVMADQGYVQAGSGVDDALTGTDWRDTLRGDLGDDTLEGGAGRDAMWGDGGDDILRGGAGDDTLRGGRQEDTLEGGAGDDQLRGQKNADLMSGGAGHDNLKGGGGNDTLDGGRGDDFLKGGTRSDVITGGDGADTLAGNAFDDTLDGGAGRDLLNAGGDDDRLIGGAGRDLMKGGAGADTFVFDQGHGRDRIVDFDLGEDRLEISAALAAGRDATSLAQAAQSVDGGLLLSLEAGAEIVFSGLSAETDLSAVIDIL